MAKIETDQETRQGPLGKPVLFVLIGALLLAAAYLIGTLVWSTTTSPPTSTGQTATEAPKDPVPAPAPRPQ